MKKLNQKAFSHIELLIVGVVIALVGVIGYTVWQRSNASNPDSKAETRSSSSDGVNIFKVKKLQYRENAGPYINYYVFATGSGHANELERQRDSSGRQIYFNEGVAFRAFTIESRKCDLVKEMKKSGGGKRTDVPLWNSGKTDANGNTILYVASTVTSYLYTNKDNEADVAKRLGFKGLGPDYRACKSMGSGRVGIYRLRKVVTEDGRRMYNYTDSKSKKRQLEQNGWKSEGIAFYGMKR